MHANQAHMRNKIVFVCFDRETQKMRLGQHTKD